MRAKINNNQKTIIWTIINKHGLDVEEFRDWLQENYGTRSTRKLSKYEADEAINALKVLIGDKYVKHPPTWGISSRQLHRTRELAEKLGWYDPKRLNGLVKKMFGKRLPEQLNKTEGTKLILALEKMNLEVIRGEKIYA